MQKIILLGMLCLFFVACGDDKKAQSDYIILQTQGSFAFGGAIIEKDGKKYRADHGIANYQIPANARKYPLVFAHGLTQSKKTWESTPDGRDGFANIFVKSGFSTYLCDQPRRASAGKSTQSVHLEPDFTDELFFTHFRLGIYPNFFEGVQFKQDEQTLNQFFRQIVPTIAKSEDLELYASAYATLFDKLGQENGGAIFITHSQGGPVGWKTALKTQHIKAIVSFEPGGELPFPKGYLPKEGRILTRAGTAEGIEIQKDEFLKFTKFPIIIYYADFIPQNMEESKDYPNNYAWRIRLNLAKEWVNLINENGGDATLVHLPEIGIKGNTHFPMSDLNNKQIADLVLQFLSDKKLD